jgi:hypothetical protein
MLTIYKYPIGIKRTTIEMPRGSQVLSVVAKSNALVMYALVQADRRARPADAEERTFVVFATGQPIEPSAWPFERKFIGTVQLSAGVFHVFEEMDKGALA